VRIASVFRWRRLVERPIEVWKVVYLAKTCWEPALEAFEVPAPIFVVVEQALLLGGWSWRFS